MLLMLSVRAAATIHYFLRAYAPTNILLRRVRARGGPKWAIPTALVLVATYLFAAAITTTVIDDGGPGWLNLVVLTCICYAEAPVMPTQWHWQKSCAAATSTNAADDRRTGASPLSVPSQGARSVDDGTGVTGSMVRMPVLYDVSPR